MLIAQSATDQSGRTGVGVDQAQAQNGQEARTVMTVTAGESSQSVNNTPLYYGAGIMAAALVIFGIAVFVRRRSGAGKTPNHA